MGGIQTQLEGRKKKYSKEKRKQEGQKLFCFFLGGSRVREVETVERKECRGKGAFLFLAFGDS